MADKKYYFPVEMWAEGISSGFVRLTIKEAQVVKKATSVKNWEKAELEKYSGSFTIETDKAIPEEWFPVHEILEREWLETMLEREHSYAS